MGIDTCDDNAPWRAASAQSGRVSHVSTDPRRRRPGRARACLGALLGWFEQETRVTVVDLSTARDGAGLYESFGFAPPRHPSLQLRTAGPSAEPSAAAQPYERSLHGSSSAERASSATADGTASGVGSAGAAEGFAA